MCNRLSILQECNVNRTGCSRWFYKIMKIVKTQLTRGLLGPQQMHVQVADRCELGTYSCFRLPTSVSHNFKVPSGLEYAQNSPFSENFTGTLEAMMDHVWWTEHASNFDFLLGVNNGKGQIERESVNARYSRLGTWPSLRVLSMGLHNCQRGQLWKYQ